jgi:hypothetical protein
VTGPNTEFATLMQRVREGSEDAAWELVQLYGEAIRRAVRRALNERLLPLLLKPSRDLDLEVPADIRQCGDKSLKNGTCTVLRVLEPYHVSENLNQWFAASAFLPPP